MKSLITTIAASLVVSVLFACGGSGEAASSPAAATPPVAPNPTTEAAGLRFALPAGWNQEPPENPMRAAQATITGSGGDGVLTVFFFGVGGGGGLDANINRWISQMTADPGVTPARNSFDNGGLHITWVEHAGTLKASQMSFPSTDMPGYRLLGAVVEGPGGPWYFKAVGPSATMEEHREGFLDMLRNLAVAGG